MLAEGRGGVRATIAMAPRASGRVGHVPHAARAAPRLSRGIIWLETEGRASLMRSRRALEIGTAAFGTTGITSTEGTNQLASTRRMTGKGPTNLKRVFRPLASCLVDTSTWV